MRTSRVHHSIFSSKCVLISTFSVFCRHLNRESTLLIIYFIPCRSWLRNIKAKNYRFPPAKCNTALLPVHSYISNVYHLIIWLLLRASHDEAHVPTMFCFGANFATQSSHHEPPQRVTQETSSCWSLLILPLFEVRVSAACRPASSGRPSQHHPLSAWLQIMAV